MIATATQARIKLPSFHPRQREIALDDARFKVAACGRRFGKTRLGAALCIMTAGQRGRAWWVAPTYKVGQVGWRLLSRMAQQVPGADVQKAERLITFPGGGEIYVRSADNPNSLRGEGLDFVVLDECAFIHEDAWQEALRPALSDHKGRAMFISTPKGQNWFYRLWLRCADPTQEEWRGWRLPTSDNPYIDPAEIEAARISLPERVFRQEYLAEFLAEAGENAFKREWWTDRSRFSADGRELRGQVVARYQSWDTAEEAGDDNAWTVCVTVEVLKDYRMAVRHVYRARMTFDALPGTIEGMARQWSEDGLLRGVVIEDKSSGKSAIYTLKASAADWLRPLIQPFRPQGSKEARASAASVWCRNGMVLLPQPGEGAEWLLTLEDELFSFPQSAFADQVDALGQAIMYLENYLSEGYRARRGRV